MHTDYTELTEYQLNISDILFYKFTFTLFFRLFCLFCVLSIFK